MNIKKIVSDTLIIILMTCAIFGVIELVLRVTFPELKDYLYSPSSLAFEYNKDYLVSMKPNVEKKYTSKGEDKGKGKAVTWKTNSLGFRGEEIGEKEGLRVIVYGDSNVHARFSEYNDTYPADLQKLLRINSPNAQVINAGMTASGPDQSLIRLSDDFNNVHPDIVIFHIFADNDYGDIIKNRLFKLSKNGELIKSGFPTTVDQRFTSIGYKIVDLFSSFYIQAGVHYLDIQYKANKEKLLSDQEKIERSLNLLEKNIVRANNIYQKDEPRQLSHFKDFYDIDIATDPEAESSRIKIALMDKILLAANKFCTDKNITFIVQIQPSVMDLTLNVGYAGYHDLAKRYKNYKPSNLTDPLKEVCTKHDLNCVHLIDSYRQNTPDTLYRHDGHWNTKGQQLAAEETAKLIQLLDLPKTQTMKSPN